MKYLVVFANGRTRIAFGSNIAVIVNQITSPDSDFDIETVVQISLIKES